jgi:hypothetical protein
VSVSVPDSGLVPPSAPLESVSPTPVLDPFASLGPPAASASSVPNKPGLTYIRTPQGTFICPTCGVVKQRQNSMHYHMKKHLEDPSHNCEYCNKSFLQKQTLELHRRSKHAEQLLEDTIRPAFSCPFQGCDFQSHTKGNCVIHCLRVHFHEEITPHLQLLHDRRVYSCLHCRNEYQSTTAFYYHIKNCITFDKTTPKYALLQGLLAKEG